MTSLTALLHIRSTHMLWPLTTPLVSPHHDLPPSHRRRAPPPRVTLANTLLINPHRHIELDLSAVRKTLDEVIGQGIILFDDDRAFSDLSNP
ncbi:hypothetical protein R3P38DRAFT_3244469, partial [Favolaschia claudopus]